jgi:hypothetical protein
LFYWDFQVRFLPHNLIQRSGLHSRSDELLEGRASFDRLMLARVTNQQ